jgi:hypothetical protein
MMTAAQPSPEGVRSAASAAPSKAADEAPRLPAESGVTARLADDLAVPAASPVHRLQAELVQFTRQVEPAAEPLYPGWFRLGFPVASSVLLWAAILWGLSRLA